jgi:spore maturation protein CgeB
MKVLYVGPIHPEGTCFARLKALQEIHEQVQPFDTSYVGQEGFRVYRYLENQLCFGKSFIHANRAILKSVLSANPAVVWVDKGFWIWPATLKTLRLAGIFLVQHNTDDIRAKHGQWSYRLMRRCLPYYDINFTTNIFNIEDFRMLGAPRVELTSLGYDHKRFKPISLSDAERVKWSTPIVFAGHWERRTEEYILALVRANIPVKVYGWNWRKSRHQSELRNVIHSEFLGRDDYLRCLVGARIGLGFVSEINRNQTAGRSFEIPACGTFLLAQRTEEHQRLYYEGKEADFFSSPQELVEKARFYLNDDEKRKQIAQRGYERCITSKYAWIDHMHRDWGKVCTYISIGAQRIS